MTEGIPVRPIPASPAQRFVANKHSAGSPIYLSIVTYGTWRAKLLDVDGPNRINVLFNPGRQGGADFIAPRTSSPGRWRTIAPMAYDEALANRIRELLAGEPGLSEQKMFGGLAFLIGGNMAVAASGQGGALVRVDPERSDAIIASTSAHPMEMRGREMRGWLRVAPEGLRTKRQLVKWVTLGVTYARSLPPKR